MTIGPGKTLLHYRLVEKLGRGGMGEVWRAVDTKLDREIAIKLLPDSVSRDPDRIARFEREAKTVARLSHPNIVTVHSVEQAGEVRFVTMEIVRGRTLGALIPRGGLPLERIFEMAIPLADAVAAAHRQGVTHRDLKPGNVMVSNEGRLMVLDFGLAKVSRAETGAEQGTQIATQTVTAEGTVVGTVAYMSPEQAEGRAVDHRSDVFSLGVMLYEMSTGRRPFQGDTPASTVSSILRDTPPSITDLRGSLPHHLGRIVRRCLAKDPERRYQTALDLRNELEELEGEIDSGARAGAGGSEPPARRRRLPAGWVAAALAGLVAVAFLGREAFAPRPRVREAGGAGARMELVNLTQSGTVEAVAISPDGRHLAYVTLERGLFGLRIKQIATGSDRAIGSRGASRLLSPEFSPDGEYVYYLVWAEQAGAIHRVPSLGGPAQKILDEVHGSFALSPDGRRVAFFRRHGAGFGVFLTSPEGSDEQLLVEHGNFRGAVGWTAEGAHVVVGRWGRSQERVRLVPVDGSPVRELGDGAWTSVLSLAPLPEGSGLLIAGTRGAHKFHRPAQIWHLALPDEELRPVTRDLSSYESLSLDRTGERLVALQRRSSHAVYLVAGAGETREVAFTAQSASYWAGVTWLPDGRLVFEKLDGENLHLWAGRPDGSDTVRLTRTGGFNMGAAIAPDGATVAFFSDRDGEFRIWLSDTDGGNARRLTTGESFGEEVFPQFSPDGDWIVYHVLDADGNPHVRRAATAGGPSTALTDYLSMFPTVSPDGRRLAFPARDPEDGRFRILVTDSDAREVLIRIDHEFGDSLPVVRWTPDGSGIAATSPTGATTNVLVHPLDRGPARQITRFEEGHVLGFGWSADGSSLAAAVGRRYGDAVLITGFRERGD